MKSDLRNNSYSILNQLLYVMSKLLVKPWIAVSRPSFCYNRIWSFEPCCNGNRLNVITIGKRGFDLLVFVHSETGLAPLSYNNQHTQKTDCNNGLDINPSQCRHRRIARSSSCCRSSKSRHSCSILTHWRPNPSQGAQHKQASYCLTQETAKSGAPWTRK